jgi:hypothetical protein
VIGRTQKQFWKFFEALPPQVQKLARDKYVLWKRNPYHPSLHFEERRNGICVVRIGEHYRALGLRERRDRSMVLDRNTRAVQSIPVLDHAVFSAPRNRVEINRR